MTVSFVYNHRPITIPQWNELDKETTKATSINCFKSHLHCVTR